MRLNSLAPAILIVALSVACSMACASCAVETTQILVVVTSDFGPGELGSYKITVVREGGSSEDALVRTRPAGEAIRPISFGIAPRTGAPEGEVVAIEITGYPDEDGRGCELARWSATTSFVRSRTMRLRVPLDRICRPEPGCEEGDLTGRLEEVSPGRELEGVEPSVSDGGSPASCGEDAGTDAGQDAGPDAGPDAGQDAGPDAGPPPIVETGARIRQLAVGSNHACVVLENDELWCWGDNSEGQILVGGNTTYPVPTHVEVVLSGTVQGIREVFLGAAATCAIVYSNGQLVCWGDNNHFRFAATAPETENIAPRTMATSATSAGIGSQHICWAAGLAGSRRVACQLQATGCRCGPCNGTTDPLDSSCTPSGTLYCRRATQNTVTGESLASASVGLSHSCALAESGRVYCWGTNSVCELGPNGPVDASTGACASATWVPREVPTPSPTRRLSVGPNSCALTEAGELLCWGNNISGLLGRGTVGGHSPTPMAPTGLPTPVTQVPHDIMAGHRCAVAAEELWCWGDNTSGELGTGAASAPVPTPTRVEGLIGRTDADLPVLLEVGVGTRFTCARSETRVRCWGLGPRGQLGDNRSTSSLTPVAVRDTWN